MEKEMYRVDNFSELKNVTAIGWHDYHDFDMHFIERLVRKEVRFEDDAGQYWEICVFSYYWREYEWEQKCASSKKELTEVLHSLGLLKDKFIGENIDLGDAVNQCREMYPIAPWEYDNGYSPIQYVY